MRRASAWPAFRSAQVYQWLNINSMPAGTVRAFADFYGYVAPLLRDGVAKFPPTIVFHNAIDRVVPPAVNSEPLLEALETESIVHEPSRSSPTWYSDRWELGLNHAFAPGGVADIDSRDRACRWIAKYV